MPYLEHRPAPPLSEFIERLWYCRGYRASHRHERVLPNGGTGIVINLAGRFAGHESPALVSGVHSKYVVIDTAELEDVIGVQFRPGGFVPFFGIPADEFSDRQVSLEAVWGGEAAALRDRLQAAPASARLAILEQALLSRGRNRLFGNAAVAWAVTQLRKPSNACVVGEVTAQIGMSRRRFAQIFREQVGVTPKRFSRIHRFQTALARIRGGGEVNWAEIALFCGYFDQAHFNNDFRAFSGINPTAYAAGRKPWTNHLAIED